MTFGPNLRVRTGTQGLSINMGDLINEGEIIAQTAGETLSISGVNALNNNLWRVEAGTWRFTAAGWQNDGTMEVAGGLLDLFSDLTLSQLFGAGTLARTGGTIDLRAVLDNTGQTFALNATTGTFRLLGGTVLGGTVTETAGAELEFTPGNVGTLDGVILDADKTATSYTLDVQNGLTLGAGGADRTLALESSTLRFRGAAAQTVDGDGVGGLEEIVSNGVGDSAITEFFAGPVTFGPNLRVRTGTQGLSINMGDLINEGEIIAQTAGEILTISGSNFSNNPGTIGAQSGGTLSLTTLATNDGTIAIGAGSTVRTNTNSLTNTGTLEIAGTLDLNGQTLTNSNILRPGTSPGITTIDGDLVLDTNSIIDIEIEGTNPVPPEFDIINVTGSATIDGTLNVIHFGGFTPTLGDTFEIITAVGGTSGQFATLNPPGGFIYDQVTGANELTLLFTNGAVFWDEGGDGLTWEDPDNWSTDAIPGVADDVLIAFGGGNIVTFNTSASIDGLFVNDTLQLQDNVLTTAAGSSSVINGTLSLESATATLTGLAGSTITFDGTFDWTAGTLSGLAPTVSATGELLMTGGGTKTFASVVLNHQSTTGTSVWTGGLLNGTFGGAFNNSGLIDFSGVGGVVGTAPGTFTNSGTITVLSGQPNIDTGVSNTGGLIHIAGGNLRHTLPWTNAGTIQIDAGTTFIVDGGVFTNTGTMLSNGTIQGFGFTNDGTFGAGASPGKTVVNTNLVLDTNSIVETELGGTNQGVDYDWIEVLNTVSLGGTLNVTHFGGFTPTPSDQFQIITATGGTSGSFATINTPLGFAYSTTINPNDVTVEFLFLPDVFWDEGGDGINWTDRLNWSTDVVPGALDDVLIAFGGGNVVTLASGNQAVNLLVTQDDSLTLTGGTLTVNSTATFDGDVSINGFGSTADLQDAASVTGTLSITGGTANLNAAATYNISSLDLSSSAILSVTDAATLLDIDTAFDFDQGSINGLGTVNLLSGSTAQLTGFNNKTLGAGVTLSNDTTFNFASTNSLTLEGILNNNNLAVIDLQGNVGLAGNGTLNNLAGGTIVKSAGAGTSDLIAVAGTTNSGLIDVQSGTLQFTTGVAHTGGELRLTSGNVLIIGGTHTFDATSSITDPGLDNNFTVQTGGTTFTMNGAYTVGGTTSVTGATANFNVDADFPTLTLSGNLNLNLASNPYTAGTLNLLSGVLTVTDAASSTRYRHCL